MSDVQPMTRVELRQWFDDHFCGCGDPPAAAAALHRILRMNVRTDVAAHEALPKLIPDNGTQWLMLYLLDRLDIVEHGGSAMSFWPTPSGERLMAGLDREEADGFSALFGDHCACGYDVCDPDHTCFP